MERYADLQKMGHTDYTRIGDLEKRFSLRDDGRARLDSEVNKHDITSWTVMHGVSIHKINYSAFCN